IQLSRAARLRALGIQETTAGVIAQQPRPAAHGDFRLLFPAVLEDLTLLSGARRDRIAACADEERVEIQLLHRAGSRAAVGYQPPRSVVYGEARFVILEVVRSLADRGAPLRYSGATLLRDDVDDAVGGLCAVERRRA